MFSANSHQKQILERKSFQNNGFRKSKDINTLIKIRHRISRNSLNRTDKMTGFLKEAKNLRNTQYDDFLGKSQSPDENRTTMFQRKSLNRFSKNQQNPQYLFFIKNQGNNTERVQQILHLRACWTKCLSKTNQTAINFYWNSSCNSSNKNQLALYGRIYGSYELTDKARLYQNVVNYCSKNHISNEMFLPVTFCFTSRQLSSQIQQNAMQFLEYFQYIKNHTSLTNSWILKPTNLNRGRDIFLFNTLQKMFQLLYVGKTVIPQTPETIKQYSKTLNKLKVYKSTHQFEQKNIQKRSLKLLPTKKLLQTKKKGNTEKSQQQTSNSNTHKTITSSKIVSQFRGISYHKKRKTMQFPQQNDLVRPRQKSLKLHTEVQLHSNKEKSYINSFLKQKYPESKNNSNQIFKRDQFKQIKNENIQSKLLMTINNLVQGGNSLYGQKNIKRQIVIQKYIQNPYLINGNKFDIRIWVLVDQEFNFYIFKSGYLRFSSEKYKLDSNSIQNNFIHLTNHAVQKYSINYEKDTNIVKMSFLKQHLEKYLPNSQQKYSQILQQIQRIITITLEATIGNFYRQQHNKQKFKSKNQFQLFGYDFLLDRELNVRLIEANCNPSITQDNAYLMQAVPRMLNDLFRLTVDKMFLPKSISKSVFHMEGINSQNMWKKLGKIGQTNVKHIQKSFQ